MKTFADSQGQTWELSINSFAIKRIRDLLSIDLLEVAIDRGALLTRLGDDPVLLVDLLYVLCRAQCEARQMTDEQFAAAIVGDGLYRAERAFLEELVGFFPPGKRAVLDAALAKLRQFISAAEERTLEKLADPELDRAVAERIAAAMQSGD